jgi:hypothetical protein
VPTVQKITDMSMQRILLTLDSKKNNWVSWLTSMHNLFKMNNAMEYIEGMLKYPNLKVDPVGAKNWHWNNGLPKS